MLRTISILAALVLTLFAGPARAQTAAEAVQRFMASTSVGCFDYDRMRQRRCPLSKDGVVAGQAEGVFPGDPRRVLLAIIAYPNESGGNSYVQFGAVFVETNGRYAFVRRLDNVYGTNFRNFGFFNGGKVQVTATVPTASDPRCCPTGTAILTIDIGPLPPPGAPVEPLPASSAAGQAKAVWTYGRHPVLGLSAHVVVGNEAYGLSCLPAPPGSTAVAAARMTAGLLPGSSEQVVVVFGDSFRTAGGGVSERPGPSGIVEKTGGYCGLMMDHMVRSRTMTLIRTSSMSLTTNEMTIEQGGRTIRIASPRDMEAVTDAVVVPLTGAGNAIRRLMRACPGIARMMDIDCTGGD